MAKPLEELRMVEAIAFRTKARTVDHLGREQIADCPTAISELWKNSYDAYARNACLNIFDGDKPVAALYDDGHGMNHDEFVNNWLVVGTESKITSTKTPEEDKNGLLTRTKQGQKGIGRLSCANLGPILLLVSKRKNDDFVTALVDWRIFENPFLDLSDILIPVVTFKNKDNLLGHIPGLFDKLLTNIKSTKDKKDEARSKRILAAWKQYDALKFKQAAPNKITPPSSSIASTIISSSFELRHIEHWSVWNGTSAHGTALLISNTTYDLEIYVDDKADDAAAQGAKAKLFETLSCFINPFVPPEESGSAPWKPQFNYEVRAWKANKSRLVVGSTKEFSRHNTEPMEHAIEGIINDRGEFIGKIKAFGEWRNKTYRITPPEDLRIPDGPTTRVGPVSLYLAAFEFQQSNTTHNDIEFLNFKELAEKYSGLMMFRDGLRVMPYGRTDNDFFEIDDRRSRNAGREFWNNRQMFGGISIRLVQNPNLKDKAGREGILDNIAAKTLKSIIANVLMQSARDYFGSSSELRKQLLPEIKESNRKQKTREERKKLRRKNTKLFKNRLKKFNEELPELVSKFKNFTDNLNITDDKSLDEAQDRLSSVREHLIDYKLPGAPKNLGTSERAFGHYRTLISNLNSNVTYLDKEVSKAIIKLEPLNPEEVFTKQVQRYAGQVNARIQKWKNEIYAIQKSEFARVNDLYKERTKKLHADAAPILSRLKREEMPLSEALNILESVKGNISRENDGLFPPYLYALESLQQSIDIELLANSSSSEIIELETELERLNSLAQLGIAVEIIGHELEQYDDIIGSGINRLPKEIEDSAAVNDIKTGYLGLTDQLRYLSPLKLSGQQVQRWIRGQEIFEYVDQFFKFSLIKSEIKFDASEAFKNIQIFDQPSRLYPVFINLVNNSRYWLSVSDKTDKKIWLDIVEEEVSVSDNGPGVDSENIENLFRLFFTTKLRGGRGVGLYLCKANLSAGGHKIRYASAQDILPLDGANFFIEFRGAEFGRS